jgi:hypothetical protein
VQITPQETPCSNSPDLIKYFFLSVPKLPASVLTKLLTNLFTIVIKTGVPYPESDPSPFQISFLKLGRPCSNLDGKFVVRNFSISFQFNRSEVPML